MRSINDQFTHLNKTVNAFDSQIRGTERSFKNMWGSFTIGLGKFLLMRHSVGIVFQDIRGMVEGVRNIMDSVMRKGEEFSNAKKVFTTAEGGNLRKAGEDWARLTQQMF